MGQPPAGELPDGKHWEDVVAEAATHAKGRGKSAEARAPAGQRRLWVMVGTGTALVLAVAWGAYNATVSVLPLSPVEQAADLRQEAAVLIAEVEAFRTLNRRLPDPKEFADRLDGGLGYEVLDPIAGLYQVTRSAGGVTVTYDGKLPLGLWILVGGTSEGGA